MYFGVTAGTIMDGFPGTVAIGTTPPTAGVSAVPFPGSAIPLSGGFSNGGTAGGQIGYNWQLNSFVRGAEGDIKYDSVSRSTTLVGPPTQVVPGPFVPGDSFVARQNWDASIRARLGFTWGAALIYATAGYAFTDVSLRSQFIVSNGFPGSSASQDKSLSGPTGGGGIEFRLSPSLSLGAEYRYTGYGSTGFGLGNIATLGFPPAGPFAVAPVSGRMSLNEHAILAKLNYHFCAPPTARSGARLHRVLRLGSRQHHPRRRGDRPAGGRCL